MNTLRKKSILLFVPIFLSACAPLPQRDDTNKRFSMPTSVQPEASAGPTVSSPAKKTLSPNEITQVLPRDATASSRGPSAVLIKVQTMTEGDLLCKTRAQREELEKQMHQAKVISGKGQLNASQASTNYVSADWFNVFGLPVANISFAGNSDSSESAFWVTVKAPQIEVLRKLREQKIILFKDRSSSNTYISKTKNNQHVSVSTVTTNTTAIMCDLVNIN